MSNDQSVKLDYETIMRTEVGRRVMWHILDESGLNDSTYTNDSHAHAYMAGRREFGLWLKNELENFTPDYYFTMIKENSNL